MRKSEKNKRRQTTTEDDRRRKTPKKTSYSASAGNRTRSLPMATADFTIKPPTHFELASDGRTVGRVDVQIWRALARLATSNHKIGDRKNYVLSMGFCGESKKGQDFPFSESLTFLAAVELHGDHQRHLFEGVRCNTSIYTAHRTSHVQCKVRKRQSRRAAWRTRRRPLYSANGMK